MDQDGTQQLDREQLRPSYAIQTDNQLPAKCRFFFTACTYVQTHAVSQESVPVVDFCRA